MDFYDHDMCNTSQNQLEVETIDEEAEYEEEEIIVPGEERRNLNQDLEEEQETDEGDPYVRDEVGVDEYDTLDDIDQDHMNPCYWMGAYTPESILARSRNTRSRFRESMRRQSLSLGGTGSRAPPPRLGTPGSSGLPSLVTM